VAAEYWQMTSRLSPALDNQNGINNARCYFGRHHRPCRLIVVLYLAMAKIGRKSETSKKKAGKFRFPAEFCGFYRKKFLFGVKNFPFLT